VLISDRQHRRTHSRPIKCQSCSKTFASRADLIRHVHSVHRIGLPRLKCTIGVCAFTSNRKDNLAQHIRRVHSSKSVQPNVDNETLETSLRVIDKVDVADAASDPFPTIGLTAFMEAASTNNYSLLEYMLSMGIHVNVETEDGYTALHCSAKAGETTMIRFLMGKGATVDPRNTKMQERRPIHEAISARHVEAMTILLHVGAEILLPDAKGQTVIDYIGLAGSVQLAQALFSEERAEICASDMASLLASACVNFGNHLVLGWLLSQFHNVLPESMNRGESPIYVTTKRGHDKVVVILLSSSHTLGHSTDGFTNSLKRSLTWAVLRGSADLVQALLRCDAIDPNQMDKYEDDFTLNRAVFRGEPKIVEALLNYHRININCRSDYGPTPLLIAANRGNCEVVEILLTHPEIDVNVWDRNDQNPLHLAISRGDSQIVRALLDHPNVRVNCQDSSFNTPFHIAAEKAHEDIIKLLLSHKDVNHQIKNRDRQTPLDVSLLGRNWGTLRLIVEHQYLTTHIRRNLKKEQLPITWHQSQFSAMSTFPGAWYTLLGKAVQSGELQVVKFLVDHLSLDANACLDGFDRHTALHDAAQYHRHDIFRLPLGSQRSNFDMRNHSLFKVLHHAIKNELHDRIHITPRPTIDRS
jgi:ankyrin repeat protein